MKLKKLLHLWQKNNLISQEQANNIFEFMKERQKENFFRLIKWLIIIGTFWFVIGLVATVISIFELDIFHKLLLKTQEFFVVLWQFIFDCLITPIHNFIIHPICVFIEKIFGSNREYFYKGTYSFIIAVFLFWVNSKIKSNKKIDSFNISEEQRNILKSNWVLEIISCIALSYTFFSYNNLLLPLKNYYTDEKIVPIWYIIGAIAFIAAAYKYRKNLYLIFGIYFITLSVGMFSGYADACYWIGISRPIVQILIGVILLLVGYATKLRLELKESKNEDEDVYILEKFSGTYYWTGLFILFVALWICSLWGFDIGIAHKNGDVIELWFANILFILASVAAMFIGTKTEQKIFFNYGLVFLIIETYTVFCARLWEYMPTGIASLILGALLIGTGKTLQKIYIKKNTKMSEKNS